MVHFTYVKRTRYIVVVGKNNSSSTTLPTENAISAVNFDVIVDDRTRLASVMEDERDNRSTTTTTTTNNNNNNNNNNNVNSTIENNSNSSNNNSNASSTSENRLLMNYIHSLENAVTAAEAEQWEKAISYLKLR